MPLLRAKVINLSLKSFTGGGQNFILMLSIYLFGIRLDNAAESSSSPTGKIYTFWTSKC